MSHKQLTLNKDIIFMDFGERVIDKLGLLKKLRCANPLLAVKCGEIVDGMAITLNKPSLFAISEESKLKNP